MRFKFANDPDRQSFIRFCRRIERHEADKDEFLKAARLQRYERRPISDERFFAILRSFVLVMGMIATVALVAICFRGCAMI